jgi:hypothetical protein
MNIRPISVSHLVFGLIFLGGAVLWAIGAATDADAPDMAVLGPTVLIGAGVAGLIAIVVNARNARVAERKASIPENDAEAHATSGTPDGTPADAFDPDDAVPSVTHEEHR